MGSCQASSVSPIDTAMIGYYSGQHDPVHVSATAANNRGEGRGGSAEQAASAAARTRELRFLSSSYLTLRGLALSGDETPAARDLPDSIYLFALKLGRVARLTVSGRYSNANANQRRISEGRQRCRSSLRQWASSGAAFARIDCKLGRVLWDDCGAQFISCSLHTLSAARRRPRGPALPPSRLLLIRSLFLPACGTATRALLARSSPAASASADAMSAGTATAGQQPAGGASSGDAVAAKAHSWAVQLERKERWVGTPPGRVLYHGGAPASALLAQAFRGGAITAGCQGAQQEDGLPSALVAAVLFPACGVAPCSSAVTCRMPTSFSSQAFPPARSPAFAASWHAATTPSCSTPLRCSATCAPGCGT